MVAVARRTRTALAASLALMAPAARVDAQPAPPASPAATAPAAGPAPPASAAGTPPTGAAATPPDRSSIFRLGAGVSTLDLGGLSPLITGHGYPAIASRVASIGSQLTWQFGRVGVGLTGETFLGTTSSHADVQLQTSGGYGMVELGFAVVRTPTFTVTPVVGVGAGVVRLEFAARDIVSLDSLIGNPRTESTVSGRSFVGELGLSLAVRLPLTWQGEHVTLGLDVGTVAPLSSTEWRRTYDAVDGQSRATMRGAYVRLSAGLTGASATEALIPTVMSLLPFLR